MGTEPTANSSLGTNGYDFTEGLTSELAFKGQVSLSQVEKEGKGCSEQREDHAQTPEDLKSLVYEAGQ